MAQRHGDVLNGLTSKILLPKSMMLHHLALKCRDVAAQAHFYSSIFELREIKRFDDDFGLRSIWLSLDSARLMLERGDAPRPVQLEDGAGYHLLAFEMRGQELPELIRRLAKFNIQIESQSKYSRYFRDLEGNLNAVSSYPEELRTDTK